MKNSTTQGAQIIELESAKSTKESEKKYGKKVIDIGFCVVPSLILRAQQRLRISPGQLNVLLQLLDYWWDSQRKPYPSKKTLGERIGRGPRQVQRYIEQLEKMGYVKRIIRRGEKNSTNVYDLSGLVEKLKELEPEFREVEDQYKEQKRSLRKRRKR